MTRLGVFLLAGSLVSVCIALVSGRRHAKEEQEGKTAEDEADTANNDLPKFDNPPDEESSDTPNLNPSKNVHSTENIIIFGADIQQGGTKGENEDGERNKGKKGEVGEAEIEEGKGKEGDEKDDGFQPFPRRPLEAGDPITPYDMLPVTQRLISKVDKPGEGKGIVSSEANPFALADTIFESFFLVPNRIVFLQDRDIAGLDALQALARSGEEVMSDELSVTEPTHQMTSDHDEGKNVSVKESPRKSRYALLSKAIGVAPVKPGKRTSEKNKKMKRKPRRSKIALRNLSDKLAKKLGKKRKLIVNPARKNYITKETRVLTAGKPAVNYTRLFAKKRAVAINQGKIKEQTNNKKTKKLTSPVNSGTTKPGEALHPETKNQVCRWRYECTDSSDLDSCRLRTHCVKRTRRAFMTEANYIGPIETPEQDGILRIKRRTDGIYPVDEEVDNILENRRKLLKPNENPNRLETLSEYFDRLIKEEKRSISSTEGTPEPKPRDSKDEESTTPETSIDPQNDEEQLQELSAEAEEIVTQAPENVLSTKENIARN